MMEEDGSCGVLFMPFSRMKKCKPVARLLIRYAVLDINTNAGFQQAPVLLATEPCTTLHATSCCFLL
jgi:hypothetical protein